ncbi:MAG: septum formation initiator family protein [Eubacterium sp.]|jgi:cell division protein FtsB|nr:septum formation initiator family protein [Eubacterium sp.]
MQETRVRKTNKQSNFGLILVFIVVITIIIASTVRSISLHQKSEELSVTQAQLEQQLEEENNKSAELEEREKYMKTKKYIEDEAKNKLGLVNEDEILIKPKEKDD